MLPNIVKVDENETNRVTSPESETHLPESSCERLRNRSACTFAQTDKTFLSVLYIIPHDGEQGRTGKNTTIHRYPIFCTRYSAMCKVYTVYHGNNETEHGLCACTVDNPLAKAQRKSLQQAHKPCSISHLHLNAQTDFSLCLYSDLDFYPTRFTCSVYGNSF